MIKTSALLLVLVAAPAFTAEPAKTTKVTSTSEQKLLVGDHPLTLQWISWDVPGRVTIREDNGALVIDGEQRNNKGDYLTVKGRVVEVKARAFTIDGEIVTRVSFNADGKTCRRSGRLTFKRTGKRKYWRLSQMKSPCGIETDYVDIYVKHAAAKTRD